MKFNLLFAFAFAALLWQLTFTTQSCDEPCQLPAPDSISVDIDPPTTATLRWSKVVNAEGYQVIVTDTNTNVVDTIIKSGEQDTVHTFNDLIPGDYYEAKVTPTCSENKESEKFILESWLMPNIIVGDVVIMMEAPDDNEDGLGNCDCGNPTSWTSINSNTDINWDMGYPIGTRMVYGFEFNASGQTQAFKLAFDKDCPYVKGLGCTGQGSITELSFFDAEETIRPVRVSITSGFTTSYVDIMLHYVSGVKTLTLTFSSPCNGCNVAYRECQSEYDPNCDDELDE